MIYGRFDFRLIFLEFFSGIKSFVFFGSQFLKFLFSCLACKIVFRKCDFRKPSVPVERYEIAGIPCEEVVFPRPSLFVSFSRLLEKLLGITKMVFDIPPTPGTVYFRFPNNKAESFPFLISERFHEIPCIPKLKAVPILHFDVLEGFLNDSYNIQCHMYEMKVV